MTNPREQLTAAVSGAGLSGLYSALELADAGYNVHVLDASGRAGGKIQSQAIGGGSVDCGAEFIDSNHQGLINLAQKLGVKLVPASDQSKEVFQVKGKILSSDAFFAAAKPMQEKIARDKQEIARNPGGERAQHLDGISLEQYMKELSGAAQPEPKSFVDRMKNGWARVKHFFNRQERRNEAIGEALARIHASEAGQDAQNISALQYVHEAPAAPGALLASDCAYRVEGGTHKLIEAMQQELERKGVSFHYNSEVTSVAKQGDQFALGIKGAGSAVFDRVVLAMPSHAIGKVEGLEALGLSPDDRAALQGGQYTHSSKFSIRTNGTEPGACLFSDKGFQAWQSGPGVVTFLAGGEKINGMKGKALVEHCLKEYAQAAGTTPDALFDRASLVFRGPDTSKPCYASPAPGQVGKLHKLAASLDRMAEHGLGIAGTFLPQRQAGDAAIGFMECGAESAQRATNAIIERDRARGLAQQQSLGVSQAIMNQVNEVAAAPEQMQAGQHVQQVSRSREQQQSGYALRG